MPKGAFHGSFLLAKILLALMAFFLVGYLLVFSASITGISIHSGIFVGLIFFFGAIFVSMTVVFQLRSLSVLRETLADLFAESERLQQSNVALNEQDRHKQQLILDLQSSEGRFRNLAEASFEGIVICSESEIHEVNDSCCTMFRADKKEMTGSSLMTWIQPESRPYFETKFHDGSDQPFECIGMRPDGTTLTIEIRKRQVEHLREKKMVIAMRDISDRKIMEDRLRYEALHDPLTGLPNRNLCLDRIRQAISRHERQPDYKFGLIFMDLDRFKVVNDSLGHTIGDKLLCDVSQRIAASIRDYDTVSRFGGDEFIILLEECSPRLALKIIHRIKAVLKEPYVYDGQSLQIAASYGLVLRNAQGLPAEKILQNANIAMHRAKQLGRDRYEIFHPKMLVRVQHLLAIENDIRRGINNREFVLYYQPIVKIKHDRSIYGFEALIRWIHPKKGFISPADFIPVAEEIGLMGELGEFVLREACTQMKKWQTSLPDDSRPFCISINLSAQQVNQASIIQIVRQTIEETGVDPKMITLEITESAVMDYPDAAMNKILQLKKLGVKIAIDDFGTGYSSLAYLERFPGDILKIDKSFIDRLDNTSKNTSIVNAIIHLAHSLGMRVVAEGIELESQLDAVVQMDCDAVQGYYFSPPVQVEKATQMLLDGFSFR